MVEKSTSYKLGTGPLERLTSQMLGYAGVTAQCSEYHLSYSLHLQEEKSMTLLQEYQENSSIKS